MKNETTDIWDYRDVNHERKRDTCVACLALRKIPLIFEICVRKKLMLELTL